jgi:transposase-like protein
MSHLAVWAQFCMTFSISLVALRRVYHRFPSRLDCIRRLEQVRWGASPVCPYCNGIGSSALPKEGRHHCKRCQTTYSVMVGTVFHNSKLDLRKWFACISIILAERKPVSVRTLAKQLSVNKKTAWQMSARIRSAMPEQRAFFIAIGASYDRKSI